MTAFTYARDALQRIQNGLAPGVIFLDINMPEMDGWEFLNEFQKLASTAKVYVLSSSIDPVDINHSKTYPSVVASISKPLTKVNLQDMFHE